MENKELYNPIHYYYYVNRILCFLHMQGKDKGTLLSQLPIQFFPHSWTRDTWTPPKVKISFIFSLYGGAYCFLLTKYLWSYPYPPKAWSHITHQKNQLSCFCTDGTNNKLHCTASSLILPLDRNRPVISAFAGFKVSQLFLDETSIKTKSNKNCMK